MQRTLACKNVRDSQINLIVSSVLQTVVIALFLLLGVFLWQFAGAHGIQITKGDELFPAVAWSGLLPAAGLIPSLFIIGLIMAGFPAGGSALTALTTSFTVDILGSDKQRTLVHSVMAILMAASILVFSALNSTSVIDAVYRLASYTYGPILGLFSFGLICKTVLTDSHDPKQYVKRMKLRDPELSKGWVQIVPLLSIMTDGGPQRMRCADMQGIFRIIQSIPSKKAEPFKIWMAQVAAERINQAIDPERSIDQAIADYRRLGYSKAWINRRIKSIEIRKGLTDEWKRGGVTKEVDFAFLTDLMSKTWSGMTTREYKKYKGLTKENLRDNMTNMELLLNALAKE